MNTLFSNFTVITTLQYIIMMFTIGIAWMLFVILPQRSYKQQQQRLFKTLRIGMRVKTIHGIQGAIDTLMGNFIILALDDGRKIEILRCTIASTINDKV